MRLKVGDKVAFYNHALTRKEGHIISINTNGLRQYIVHIASSDFVGAAKSYEALAQCVRKISKNPRTKRRRWTVEHSPIVSDNRLFNGPGICAMGRIHETKNLPFRTTKWIESLE